jgi:phage-related protein
MTWEVRVHPQVEKFIDKHLDPGDRVRVLELLDRPAMHGTKLGRPYTRRIERELWELRPQTTRGTYRLLYCLVPQRRFLIVHGMRKRKITKKIKRTARNRVAYFEEET